MIRAGACARGVMAASILAAVITGAPSPAGAQISGGCSATINGFDAGAAQTVRDAIPVEYNQSVVVTGTAPGPISTYNIYLVFAGIKIPAGSGTVSDNKSTYQTTVNVADYAKYGVGLYRVQGETSPTPCEGWAYVKVTGKFPLTTVAGIVGLFLTLLGLVGLIFSKPKKPKMAPVSTAPPGYAAPGQPPGYPPAGYPPAGQPPLPGPGGPT